MLQVVQGFVQTPGWGRGMVLQQYIGLYGEEWQCCPVSAALLRGETALGLMVTLCEWA